MTVLWALTFFVTFGLTTWIPSIYVTVFHVPVRDALLYSAWGAAAFLFASPFAGLVMDRIGRRPICYLGVLRRHGLHAVAGHPSAHQ